MPCLRSAMPGSKVREWALKSLGEFRGDKALAKARLLQLAGDRELPEATRALAARIAGTTQLDAAEVAALAENLDAAGNDFKGLLLEIIRDHGASAGVPRRCGKAFGRTGCRRAVGRLCRPGSD